MRDRANINTNLWTDQDWRDVPKTAKYLYMLLLTHPTLNYAGVADWRPARLAAMSPDDTADDVRRDAEALQDARFIFIDEDTEEVLIRSFLRHDGLLKQPKLSISMVNAFAGIASKQVRQVVVYELQRLLSEFPSWAAFGQEKVQALTKLEGNDMGEFTQGFTPTVTPGFTQTHGQADPLPTSTATTTTTSKDKSFSSEVADATPRPEVEQLLDLLDEGIEANGAKKPTRTKKNTDAARLLLDRDGWTVEQVSWMIRWATRDEFWRRNILSMSKLREKFDQLKLQSGAGKSVEEINPDKVLGPDYWTPPPAPSGLSIQDEMAWKREQAKAHREERLAEAMRKVSA